MKNHMLGAAALLGMTALSALGLRLTPNGSNLYTRHNV
jgi:hypothetical protein